MRSLALSACPLLKTGGKFELFISAASGARNTLQRYHIDALMKRAISFRREQFLCRERFLFAVSDFFLP